MMIIRSINPAFRMPLCPGGFTAVDLLVAIVTVVTLAATFLPALAKSQTKSRGPQCLYNHKQLSLAWNLYALDNNTRICRTAGLDSLVSSVSPTKNYPLNQWCMGTMDYAPSWTNKALIMDSLLFKFVGNVDSYRCPQDPSSIQGNVIKVHEGSGLARARSVSMNMWMNPINSWSLDSRDGAYPVKNFRVLANVTRPGLTFLTVDENPQTINDGWFNCDPRNSSWTDIPATFHDGAAAMSFADGHSEMRKWTDPAVFGSGAQFGARPQDNGSDLKWLQNRSTY
jgi:prepilin-type processing-associated H-X9-DG protein